MKQNNTSDSVMQCSRCNAWANRHDSGLCKVCRYMAPKARKARRQGSSRRPVVGSAEWAETRGDDLGESPDY